MKTINCISLFLPILLTSLLLLFYTIASFPSSPHTVTTVHHSLAALPEACISWKIYPEDFYEGGAYVTLPQGKTRYWIMGPENSGQKIVLIHGLSIPSMVYKNVAPALASKGYRVLLYDLYGRGYSDAPQVTYDTALYATQLALLMQHVRWEKANIVGVSMGAGIGVAVADLFPHLVSGKVALIAPAGLLESGDISRTVKFMSSPLIQDITSSFPFRVYMQHLANTSESTLSSDPIHEIVRLQSAHLPGYNRALASSIRSGPIRGQERSFAALGQSGRDVLLIHGTADRTVPYKHASTIQALIPNAQLVTVDGAGHDLTVTHSDLVANALLTFFATRESWVPKFFQ
ncbi:hypothetical protein HWV62_11666 [Athelia sp. TMB]|nr:hypothetical protein HWV62_11666 [Athelia sp. TMB]